MAQPLSDFDPDFASPAQWAEMYRSRGLQVIPCYMPGETAAWKRPLLSTWTTLQETLVPDAAFARWYGPGGEHAGRRNMGIITGRASGDTLVVDLDDHKTLTAADWWQGLIAVENNNMDIETVEQLTGGGGRQKLFRYPPGWRAPTNRTSIGVDIRGQAGFAVMPPSHHESGHDYEWMAGRAPWEIEIAMAPQWLLDAIEALVEAYGGDKGNTPGGRTASPANDYDAFGNLQDHREWVMFRTVWHEVLEWYRECPIKPPEGQWQARAERAYELYERKVTTRIQDTADKRAGLERTGRGPPAPARPLSGRSGALPCGTGAVPGWRRKRLSRVLAKNSLLMRTNSPAPRSRPRRRPRQIPAHYWNTSTCGKSRLWRTPYSLLPAW